VKPEYKVYASATQAVFCAHYSLGGPASWPAGSPRRRARTRDAGHWCSMRTRTRHAGGSLVRGRSIGSRGSVVQNQ